MSGLDWLDGGPDEWTRSYVAGLWAGCPFMGFVVMMALLVVPVFGRAIDE